MINRDFTKSSKSYVKQNRFVLIALALICVLSIVMVCIFGFKGGPDVKGYNTFSVNIDNYQSKDLSDYTQEINTCLAGQNAKLQSVQITGEGDGTTLIVKYSGKLTDVAKLNEDLATELNISAENISEHTGVNASLVGNDYIYTIAAGLIILTLAVIFIAIRYNLACAMATFAGSVLGIILLMALTIIFRLTINSSFLAINIINLLLILGESFMLFDALEKERVKLKDKNDRSTQLGNALKSNSFRQKFMYGALFAIALIFIILMPTAIKQASLIVLFAIITTMFVSIYALPFVWCLTITQVSDKIRVKKEKVTKNKQIEIVEGELEQNYTENQVIEVKEDDGSMSSDDSVIIE